MEADPEDGTAIGFGVSGTGTTNIGIDGVDTADVPDALVAVMVNV